MMPLSTILTLLIGPTLPAPASPLLLDALDHVEVTTSDRGRSGFQIVFSAGRSGSADLIDYPRVGEGHRRGVVPELLGDSHPVNEEPLPQSLDALS